MSTKKTTTRYQTLLSNGVRFFKKQYENGKKKKHLTKKNSTTLRVRKLSPTLILTKPSVPYLSCSDEKEIFKPGVAVPNVRSTFEYLTITCKMATILKNILLCILEFNCYCWVRSCNPSIQ